MSRIIDLDNLLLNPTDFSDKAVIDESKKQLFDSVFKKLYDTLNGFDEVSIRALHTSQIVEKLLAELTVEEASILLFKGAGDHINTVIDGMRQIAMFKAALQN